MKCPHCTVEFHDKPNFSDLGSDKDGYWGAVVLTCPACNRLVVILANGQDPRRSQFGNVIGLGTVLRRITVYPHGSARPPVPLEVPPAIAGDYTEACLVLSDSPKASAALSRRCLQHLLRDAAAVRSSDLAKEIQEVLDSRVLPSHLADIIDAVRNIGNFSAHPIKATATGEIVDVEPHEAEWNLDVLEGLFDFFYVRPALTAKKRAALNAKLQQAGKPPIK